MVAAGDEPIWPDDAVEVGRIVGAWGTRGAIKVQPHAADPQALYSSRRWFLCGGLDGPPGANKLGQRCLLHISQVREQGDAVVATAHDLSDRDAAQALAGMRVHVARSSFPTPAADEYYWVDLIGLRVVNRQGEDLGTVADLVQTGPHCVLRLDAAGAIGQARMIPFVSAYVDRVDLAARRIEVDWPADF